MERARDSGSASKSSGDLMPTEAGGGPRHWMRAGLAVPASGGAPRAARAAGASNRAGGERGNAQPGADAVAKPSQPSPKRFVEPYPFDDEQRRLIDQALVDAGVDDASGRAIFIGAIAYDVALLGADMKADEAPAEPPAESRPQAAAADPSADKRVTDLDIERPSLQTLKQLADAAEQLRQGLNALDPTDTTRLIDALNAEDPFARGHGPDYLAAVTAELRRIAAACGHMLDAAGAPDADQAAGQADRAPSPPPDTAPAGSGAARSEQRGVSDRRATHPAAQRFVEDAARVYREAFDLQPTSRAGDPFARALKAIAKATGLPIPTDVATLKQVLGRG
jgi:hypothetical protein